MRKSDKIWTCIVTLWVYKLCPFWQLPRFGIQRAAKRRLQLFFCREERRGASWGGVQCPHPHPTLVLIPSQKSGWVCHCAVPCHTPFSLEGILGTSEVPLFHGRGHWGQERLSDLPEATPQFSPGVGLISQITRSASGMIFTSAK